MAISTQLRLIQVTGSVGSGTGQLNDQLARVASGSISAADVSGLMSYMASSLKRLHGAQDFSNNVEGVITGSAASTEAIKLYASDAAGGITLDAPGSTASITQQAGLLLSMSAAGASSNAIDINASDASGGILMRAGGGGFDLNVVNGAATIDAASLGETAASSAAFGGMTGMEGGRRTVYRAFATMSRGALSAAGSRLNLVY